MLEVGAGGFGIFRPGWDGHEAAGFEVGEGDEGFQEFGERGWGEAVLGVFVGEFYFDEDGDGFIEGLRGGMEALSGFEVVEGVDGVEELGGFGGLVVL